MRLILAVFNQAMALPPIEYAPLINHVATIYIDWALGKQLPPRVDAAVFCTLHRHFLAHTFSIWFVDALRLRQR